MSESNISNLYEILAALEQRMKSGCAEIKQRLTDLIYKEEVNEVWKQGVESKMQSMWEKVCTQSVSVSDNCQTDEQLEQDCNTSPEPSTHIDEIGPDSPVEENCFASSPKENGKSNSLEQIDIQVESTSSTAVRENESSTPDISCVPQEQRSTPAKKVRSNSVKTYPCVHCESTFLRKDRLVRHQRRHKDCQTCQVCSHVFTDRNDKKKHQCIRRQERKSRFECKKCGKSYSTSGSLASHMFRHGGKKHVCSVCGKAFHYKPHLAIHMCTHTGERPFRCDICSSGFTTRGQCKRHVRLCHTKRNE